MKNKKVKIAVISDIHFSSEDHEKNAVKTSEALLKKLKEEDFKYLIVNGDIVQNGSKEEDFKLASDFFQKLIKEKENLTIDNIFFVVGNHDVCRLGLPKIKNKFFNNRDDINYSKKNDLLTFDKVDSENKDSETKISYFKPIFNNYIAFLKSLEIKPYINSYTKGKSDAYKWINFLTGYKVLEEDNIILFVNNSSWYAEENDIGKLVLGKYILDENIEAIKKKIKDDKKNIVINCLHHDLLVDLHWEVTNISQDSYYSSYGSLTEISDLIITSHRHILPSSPSYFQSSKLVVSTGSVYDKTEHVNSFKILEIDIDNKRVTVEDYVQENKLKSIFYKIEPVTTAIETPIINPYFDKRVYPIDLKLTKKKGIKDKLFWEKNKKHNDKKLKKEATITYLKKLYNTNYGITITHIKNNNKGDSIFSYNKSIIAFMYVKKHETEDEFINRINVNIKKKYHNKYNFIIIVPHHLIINENFFKSDEGNETFQGNDIDHKPDTDFSHKILFNKEIKNKFTDDKTIYIQDFIFYTKEEIKKKKSNKIIRENINKFTEIVNI